MSDLPNFKRSFARRLGLTRVAVAIVVVIMTAIAFGFSEMKPGDGLSVRFSPASESIANGSSYIVQAVIKNDDAKTTRVEIQGVLYAAASACMEKGKHLTMSMPVVVNVGPNATVSTDLLFDVSTPCKMSAGMKAFVNGSIDSKRFSSTRDSGLFIQIL